MRRRDWQGENPFNEPVQPRPLPELNIQEVDKIGFGGLSLPIVRSQDGTVYFGNQFIVSATGAVVAATVTETEFWAFLDGIRQITTAVQWIIGDLVVHAEAHIQTNYETIAERTGYKPDTIEYFASIARNVPWLVRTNRLTFGHHALVAAKHEDEQRDWLEKAAKNNWSVAELRFQISGKERPVVSLIADKTYRNIMNRVWRNAQRGTLDKIKDADLDMMEAWVKELRGRRND